MNKNIILKKKKVGTEKGSYITAWFLFLTENT